MFERGRLPAGTRGVLAAAAAAVCLGGCLTSESADERLTLDADGRRGAYSLVLRDIRSDGPTPFHQGRDFERLVEMLEGDAYLLDRLEFGIYVKERSLRVEDGVLVGRETGLFAGPASVDLRLEPDGSFRRPVRGDATVEATNGRVVRDGDSTYVTWPHGTRAFTLTTRRPGPELKGDLVGRFKAWAEKR